MKLFIIVVLLNIYSYADAQVRNNNDSLNAKINRPEKVTITGENILIYRWDDTKTSDNYCITTGFGQHPEKNQYHLVAAYSIVKNYQAY